MMQYKQIYIVFFLITLNSIHGKFIPARSTRTTTTQPMTHKDTLDIMPRKVRVKDYPDFKIPTAHFCSKMEMQPASYYVVLPWWYHYCQGLKDKQIKHDRSYKLSQYRHILNQVNAYKKTLKRRSKRVNSVK